MSQDGKVETSSKKIYMLEIGESPKQPIKFMFTEVGSCYKILFFKLVINSVEMRQQCIQPQHQLNNTAVRLDIHSLRHASRPELTSVNKQKISA